MKAFIHPKVNLALTLIVPPTTLHLAPNFGGGQKAVRKTAGITIMKTPAPKNSNLVTTVIVLGIMTLLPRASTALTVTDGFTSAANWEIPFTSGPEYNLGVSSGRMNYTATTTNVGGAVVRRIANDLPGNTNVLLTTQDWSLKVDVHVDPFTVTAYEQFTDVFLGIGKTGDELNTHVTFEFDRGGWEYFNDYDIGDDVRINGEDAAGLFNLSGLTSPDATLRFDFNAASQSITYRFDADGATGGYNWVTMGTANLASGTYNLQMNATDTFSIILVGSSAHQAVAAGQAYLDNLEITVPTTDYAPDSIAGYTVAVTITNINGVNIPPALGTNFYGVTTFSQIGPNADNTYGGTYTYVKTGANTGTIFIAKTAPPDQAGETTTNYLVFSSALSGTFALHYDFDDTPPTVQYGAFQVLHTNELTGAVQVTISPAGAIGAGAQWQVDGGAWQNTGNTVTNLAAGNHTVAYKTISGWNTPTSQTVPIAANTTTVTNGVYVEQTGSLLVTIDPANAVTAGAQWQVDGGAWQNSGAVVSGLAAGNHPVSFKNIPDWIAPLSQFVSVSPNTTITANGLYVPSGGPVTPFPIVCSLQVGSFTMAYPVSPSQTYILQYTDDLTPPATWRPFLPLISSPITVTTSGSAHRYFRVRVGDSFPAVYSVNVVGYVRRIMQPGLNLVANPLNSCSDNSIASLFPNCPPNSEILLPAPNGSLVPESGFSGGVWDQPNLTLAPGQGIGFWNPASAFEVTFAGEVPAGTLTTALPAGISLVGSQAPVNGLLNFPAQQGDEITTWDATNQTPVIHEYLSGNWQPAAPAISPGDAFWVQVSQFKQWTQPLEPWNDLEVWESPIITRQPENLTTPPGNTAHFTVQAISSLPLYYQWRKDGTNLLNSERILGANTYALAITNMQSGDAGNYTVVITNIYGSVTSSVATLTVQVPPLLIVSTNGNFGVSNGSFGFTLAGAPGQTVVTEVSTNLSVWLPLKTNILTTGSIYFSDPQWMNYSRRYYRIRSP